MTLSWSEYKKVVEGFFKRCFDNCKLIEDYEKEVNYFGIYDFINEDNFYIKYICKSLESYMRNYQKQYYGLYVKGSKDKNYKIKRCQLCGCLIEVTGKKDFSTKYCKECKNKIKKEQTRLRVKKYRDRKCNAS
jgi:hypothetical protein